MGSGYLAQDTADFRVLDVLLNDWTDKMRLMNTENTADNLSIANIVRQRLEIVAGMTAFRDRDSILPQLLYFIEGEQVWNDKIPVLHKRLGLLIGYDFWHLNRCTGFKVHNFSLERLSVNS